MRKIFYFMILLCICPVVLASDHIVYKDNVGILLPSNYCDITDQPMGLFVQESFEAAFQPIEIIVQRRTVLLVMEPCDNYDDMYSLGVLSMHEIGDHHIDTQKEYNQVMQKNPHLVILYADDQVIVYHSRYQHGTVDVTSETLIDGYWYDMRLSFDQADSSDFDYSDITSYLVANAKYMHANYKSSHH